VSGAEIAFNGPIHFSIVPDFGIVIEDMSYATADGAASVTAARSVASVDLMSVFSSQVRITGIALESPRILLGEASGAAQPAPAEAGGGDIFETLAGFLERLSIDQVVVSDGEVASRRGDGIEPIASAIDLRLSVPGVDRPASLTVSGLMNGSKVEVSTEIGSLRDLLARQPAAFKFSSKLDQPPHPLLANLSASGNIQLAEDGSYRISGGEIDSSGQKMRLDVSYAPGDRPFVMARVDAGDLDYSDFQPAGEAAATEGGASTGAQPGPNLAGLRNIDADVELRAASIKAGDALAKDVVLGAQLRNGQLNASAKSAAIAGGSFAASLATDVNGDRPQSSGSLDVSAIDIGQVLKLAGQSAPVSGKVSSQLQYAFWGANVEDIRNSINVRGTVSVGGGRVQVAQLAGLAGAGSDVSDALELTAKVDDVRQPLSLSGTARWNGEALGFAATMALADLLWGQPGKLAVDLKSQPLNANFSGTLSAEGAVAGKADVSAPSLSRALGWLGQSTGTPLGRFNFSGGVSVSSSEVAMTEASISLDDMGAKGSVAVALTGKPKITAALSVDVLDFGALTGGGSGGAATASAGPAPIDLAVLRLFDADIRLNANQIGYGDVKAGPATASLSVSGGVAKVSLPQAGFFGGALTAEVTANGAGDVPAIDLVAAMEGVDALPLLSTAAGFQNLEGKLKASVQVKGAGSNTEAFTRSLNGPINVVFADGALRGIDVAGLFRNVQSLIGGSYAANNEAKTEFTELSVAASVESGVAKIGGIRLLGPLVRMSGQGSVDLVAQTIDMRLDPRVVASLDGQGSAFDVSGIGMPIIINGALSRPSIYPDLSSILADPNRALQAMSQLGGGLGELANGASGALGGLGGALGGNAGQAADGVMTDLLGRLGGGQAGAGTGATPQNGQDLLNSVVGGMFGGGQAPVPATGAPGLPAVPPAETAPQTSPPVQTAPANIPLPRMDPRGPAPSVPSAPSVAPPVVTAPVETPPVEVPAEQTAPPPEAGSGAFDLINNLIEQTGM
jgi:AsmA protein